MDYKFNKRWSLGAEIEFEAGGTGIEYELETGTGSENGEYETEVEKGGEVALEQFHITYDGPGLEATITNRQFHGREIHYAVTCGKEEFQVFARSGEVFSPGESVRLVFTA